MIGVYCSLVCSGAVVLDKVTFARTAVNKSGMIDNTYRNFEMEVIAGEDDFVTTVKEKKFRYQLDFSKVYWNPKLSESKCIIYEPCKKSRFF